MVTILPPDASITFIAAILVPIILGFLVGIVVKSALKIGIAIALLVLILMAVGIITPDQIIQPILSVFRSGSALAVKVKQIAGYLPYASITFIVGLLIGFFKG
jgi:uncharacterized membrane protein (Fun14 family)